MQRLPEPIALSCSNLTRSPIRNATQVRGGGNSQIWRIETEEGALACKIYFADANDKRRRLETEFGAHTFLWTSGVRNIPEPVSFDSEHKFALFKFIDGAPVIGAPITSHDIQSAVEFIQRLFNLSKQTGGYDFSPASEAYFSIRDVIENIRARLDRLAAIKEDASNADLFRQFSHFVGEELLIALSSVESAARRNSPGIERELSLGQRTLSPSDFGFHNAIRKPTGEIIYIDFEYFGWDDPAKLISDFVIHPAMKLTDSLSSALVHQLKNVFSSDSTLEDRLEAVFPLYGLKWCCIVLNEFVPEIRARRHFAGKTDASGDSQIMKMQLEKSRLLFQKFCRPGSLREITG